MSPSIHELKRMVRKAVPKTSKCDRCDKRRVLVDGMLCRACKDGPKPKKSRARYPIGIWGHLIITPTQKKIMRRMGIDV